MKYIVLKQHFGDRQYFEGDEREVDNADTAKTLMQIGLIGEKEAPKPVNKMERQPKNKAE